MLQRFAKDSRCDRFFTSEIFEDVVGEQWLAEISPTTQQPSTTTAVAQSIKRQAIDLHLKISRATEEIGMTKREMERVLKFLKREHQSISVEIDRYKDNGDRFSRGIVSALMKIIIKLEREIRSCLSEFCEFISVESFECDNLTRYLSHCINVEQDGSQQKDEDGCETDDEEEENEDEDDEYDEYDEFVDLSMHASQEF